MASSVSAKPPNAKRRSHDSDTDDDAIPSLAVPRGFNPDQLPTDTGIKRFVRVKTLLITFTVIAAVSLVFFAASQLGTNVNGAAVKAFNASRDYRQTPFDILDAQQICQFQTQETHGKRLLMSYLDTHSSRFEPRLGIYKIFLVAHIGNRNEYDEATIHCHINPSKHLINHYKTVFPEKSSIMSRAIRFFTP
ncbi:MAG TPA: hypothetical protein VIC26_00750 [Marinagarivorans sp.]